MKSVKLFEGVGVMKHGEYTKTETVSELFDLLNIGGTEKQIEQTRQEITRSIVGMGYCILTGSDGFPVFLQVIPNKKEEE